MNLDVIDRGDRRLLISAAIGATAVLISVIIANVLGELPDPLWFLCVPIGLLGGGITCLVSLVLLLIRRASASVRQRPPRP